LPVRKRVARERAKRQCSILISHFLADEGSENMTEQQQELVKWVNSILANCERPEPPIKYANLKEREMRKCETKKRGNLTTSPEIYCRTCGQE
jgi:hypothetical protein